MQNEHCFICTLFQRCNEPWIVCAMMLSVPDAPQTHPCKASESSLISPSLAEGAQTPEVESGSHIQIDASMEVDSNCSGWYPAYNFKMDF
jgi:hypothetical protein